MKPQSRAKVFEVRRLEAIRLINEKDMSQSETARHLGVSIRAVQYWISTFRTKGKKGLAAVPRSGRPSRLTSGQKKQLARILLKGAIKAGFSTDLWTCPRVAHMIQKKWGIAYHVDHVLRLLYSLGFTPQKPQHRAYERNEKQIRNWVHHTWPRIKKKPSKTGQPLPSLTNPASS